MGRLDEVKRAAERAVLGLSHSERERAAMEIASAIAGEEVQFLSCRRSDLTGKNVLTGFIEQTNARPRSLKEFQARRDAREGKPATGLTDDGKHPVLLAALRDGSVKTYGQWKRLKDSLNGKGDAA